MQFVDKHDSTIPTSDNWRTKVSPIPSFLQQADTDILLATEEKDKGSPLMKGILYTILTATIGVLVGYIVSYLMRTPQASTMQAYEELVNVVKTQSGAILPGEKAAPGKADGKGDGKSAASTSAQGGKAAAPTAAPSANASNAAAAPAAPATPTPPKEASAKPTAPAPADKPKEAPPPATDAAKAGKKPVLQGPVFLSGTNPYGPPPMVEQDLFNPSTLLKVEYDPANPPASPAVYQPEETQRPHNFQELVQDPLPTPAAVIMENDGPTSGFQVQLGAFNSRMNALQFANRLQEKGYEVNIYEGWTKNRGAWYYVRLDKMLDHSGALETAKNIQTAEKFLPMVVQPTSQEKKLR